MSAKNSLSLIFRAPPTVISYTVPGVGEMVQLRKQDLRHEDGLWVITITPEAGRVKDAEFREVPLHGHLVQLNFPTFVRECLSEYLFMNPSDANEKAIRGAWGTSKNRVTEFVREVITDVSVQPNHAWRHRFMTVGRNLQIPRDIRFAITGHASKDEGDDYGEVSNETKAGALLKYPRYEI